MFAPKYTPTVVPTIVPSPQAGVSIGIPTTPVETLDSSITNDTPYNSTEAANPKGKEVINEKKQTEKTIFAEEGKEFLKLIKHCDFKIVDQLGQTPSKISILSLFLSSESHRKALMKVLNITHVMQDISVDQFDDVVANIFASRYLGFNEAKLTVEGHNYNKALHISVTCINTLISRVLVDIGSSLNVFPKSTLSQLQYEGPEMRSSALIVRAFDGYQREVIGELDLPICVGPHQFTITFQVMDINPAYSCLLRRPWIHATGTVTSSLHQKLKFLVEDKLVIVFGDEDSIISELSSFIYVDTKEGIAEVPLQGLDFEEVSTAFANPNQSTTLVL